MSQFWAHEAASPATTTFGSGLELEDVPWHSQLNDTHKGLRGLAIVLLRFFHPRSDQFFLEGEPAVALAEILRRTSAKDNESKSTWLQDVFGVAPGARIPTTLLAQSGSDATIRIQLPYEQWARADFAVFVHVTAAEVKAAYRASLSRGRSPRTYAGGLESSRFNALADELEGEVAAHLSVRVRKNGRGQWLDPEAEKSSSLLPVTSDDRFQLCVAAKPQAHLYLVWVDSLGNLIPLFPWSPVEGWRDISAMTRDLPRSTLTLNDDILEFLPPDKQQLYSHGKPGAETFVLLAHRNALDLQSIHEFFHSVRTPKSIGFRHQHCPERFPVRRMAAEVEGTKAAGLAPAPDADALDRLRLGLERALHFRVDYVAALVLPSLGGKPGDAH